MLYIGRIPLADVQLYKLRGYALKHWGAVRAVAVLVLGLELPAAAQQL